MSVLSRPYFHDEQAAFDFVEKVIWPKGPICPHCGCSDHITAITPNRAKRVRYGLKKCRDCLGQFTVRMGTIFEESKLSMTKWLQAIFLMTASKKGVSAHQLHRTLEVTYKTAWFLAHRIREAMRDGELAPFGGEGGIVEVDETFIGIDKDADARLAGKRTAHHHKMKVLTLVDRRSGRARSMVVDRLTVQEIVPIIEANVYEESHVMTDEAGIYRGLGWSFDKHSSVTHARDEYVNKDFPHIHTNTIEGFYSIFKRGMRGVYQHCAKKHLYRYAAEFDFRYSYRVKNGYDDSARAVKALEGVVGKRLTYRSTDVRREGAHA
jgi:transposase-like protein